MTDEQEHMFADGDEGFAEGDPDLSSIDWAEVEELERRQQEVLSVPEDQRPMEMLGLLHEMYGDELEVL